MILRCALAVLAVLGLIHIVLLSLVVRRGERSFRILSSTKKMAAQFSLWKLVNPRYFQHGYVYLRWLRRYVSFGLWVMKVPVLGPFLIKTFIVPGYHGKAATAQEAARIISIDHDVARHDVGKTVVPYKTARDVLIQAPLDIVVTECPCRASRTEPCLPLDVCMIVGQPFTDFILEHRPENSRRVSRREALEILEAERQRGHVHSLWFKEAMAGRFFALCNCCSCCCVGLELVSSLGIDIIASSGYTVLIDESGCTACGTCLERCPFGALEMREDRVVVKGDKCRGCGVCIDACPAGALALVKNREGVMPLELD